MGRSVSTKKLLPPNFLLIGAPKCGSTSLWKVLRQHPNVFMPEEKEPNFFASDDKYSEAEYRALFNGSDSYTAVGEASVAYSLVERNPGAPERIAERVPSARLLYIVRHPLRRIESAWLHHSRLDADVSSDFPKAVRTFPPLLEGTRYMRNLDCYRRNFPDKRIHVLFLEDFAEDAPAVLERCDRFLGVNPNARSHSELAKENVSSQKERLHPLIHQIHEADWWQRVRAIVPPRLRRFVVRATRQNLSERPKWNPATRRWALNQLQRDVQEILQYAGKPPDFWNLTAGG